LPISMPIVATVAFDLFDMAMLRLTIAPSQYDSRWGQEHGRTHAISRLRKDLRSDRPGLASFAIAIAEVAQEGPA
jgi:hypothetical protein